MVSVHPSFNKLGWSVSFAAKPTFKSPTDRPQNTNATDGEDAVFKCNAEAIPDATVVWLHDGNAIDGMLIVLDIFNLIIFSHFCCSFLQ